MPFRALTPAPACLLLFLSLQVFAQTLPAAPTLSAHSLTDDDPRLILEVGGAAGWNTAGGATTFAPNFAAETTPVENVLELEAGTSPFFTRNSTEWDTDLLFKKPWTLSPSAEFMLGLGPEWVYLKQSGHVTNTLAVELAGDFMFWPTGRHRFGWYLEPAYDRSFATGHPQSLDISAGLLVGVDRKHSTRRQP